MVHISQLVYGLHKIQQYTVLFFFGFCNFVSFKRYGLLAQTANSNLQGWYRSWMPHKNLVRKKNLILQSKICACFYLIFLAAKYPQVIYRPPNMKGPMRKLLPLYMANAPLTKRTMLPWSLDKTLSLFHQAEKNDDNIK
jgi:hypothetical protein